MEKLKVYSQQQVQNALATKGFKRIKQGDHPKYVLRDRSNHDTTVRIKIKNRHSGKKGEIHKGMLEDWADNIGVDLEFFIQFIECHRNKEDLLTQLQIQT
jgi:hypothetical protein